MEFEYVVAQQFSFNGKVYLRGDVLTGDDYTAVNNDPHYSSGVFVTQRQSTAQAFPTP